jgi:AcrR family transcriptional regulator
MELRSKPCQDGRMATITVRTERRSDALTRSRIIDTAIALLDEGGTEALTFRTLSAALSTGAGALYHHVANKGELLAAAAMAKTTAVLAAAGEVGGAVGIRALTTELFDAITAHPWLGSQLVAAPWQPAVLQLFDAIGSKLTALGVPERSEFDAASALVHHILGVASQYDAGRSLAGTTSRPAFLDSATAALVEEGGEAPAYPFLARVGRELVEHDDRAQFQAGIDIILVGIDALAHADHPTSRKGEQR